jgi:hypothetical protein
MGKFDPVKEKARIYSEVLQRGKIHNIVSMNPL